jgi:hypothetical protein
MDEKTIELDVRNDEELAEEVQDAADLAGAQDRKTWLASSGKRIAAIVPVDVAEYHEQMVADVLATEFGPGEPVRYPDVRVKRASLHDGDTAVLLSVTLGAMRARAVPLAELREFRQAIFDAGSYERALALAGQTVSFE